MKNKLFAAAGMLVTIGAAAAFTIILEKALTPAPQVFAAVNTPSSSSAASAPSASIAPIAVGITPARLSIPSLKIDAKVETVGITTKGSIGTPSSFTTVAWYEYSPAPGNPGLSIIDGHVDNGLSLAGVFKHLSLIRIGDDIDVADANGNKLSFTVVATSSVDYTSKLSSVTDLATSSTTPELALITCEGTWVPSGKTYDRRIVVIATLNEMSTE